MGGDDASAKSVWTRSSAASATVGPPPNGLLALSSGASLRSATAGRNGARAASVDAEGPGTNGEVLNPDDFASAGEAC